jgi:hypothetical protein
MSDVDEWAEAPAPKRKGPPKWMLFVGCGCLIPGFVIVALVAWAMQFFGAATNPRQAYDALATTLPFDDSLKGRATGLADDPSTRELESHEDPEFHLFFGGDIPFSGGVQIFMFGRGVTVVDEKPQYGPESLLAIITRIPSSQGDKVLRGPEGTEQEPFQIDVQGATLSGLRSPNVRSDVMVEFPRGTAEVTGPGVSLRLRSSVAEDPEDPESDEFDVLLTLQRPTEGAAAITDDDIRGFLAPFHIGPNR